MRAAVLVFPGSNCDRDMRVALEAAGAEVSMVWHKESDLPDRVDLVAIPGGFSFGDYLRCGAIAGRAPIARALVAHAARGGYVLGVCNGFQILTETGLLPGALMRNSGLKFLCRSVGLSVETAESDFTCGYKPGTRIVLPVAHHDGNYSVGDDDLARLRGGDRIAFRYDEDLNGSCDAIAGVLSENRRVLGMMPHPERAVDERQGGRDGAFLFKGLVKSLARV